MSIFYGILNIDEVVLDRSPANESTLGAGDEALKLRAQPICKDFAENLGKTVQQTDGPEIRGMHGICNLWQQHNVSRIEQFAVVSSEVTELLNRSYQILLY